jgi:hypothetical protein
MKYPEIRIKYAWLLVDAASEPMNKLWGNAEPLRSHKEYETIVESYKTAWAPYEKRILQAMCEGVGLSFRQNIVDVNIAPWFGAISDPLVIGVMNTPDRFVEILTHEVIHRLLTDNNETRYDTLYADEWKKLFGDDHTFVELVHIPVHAVMQFVFDDVLKEPGRTTNDKNRVKEYDDYHSAWKYVEEFGYKRVVEQLKENYEALVKKTDKAG